MNTKINSKTIIRKSLSSDEEIFIGEKEELTYIFFTDSQKSVNCQLSFFLSGSGSLVKVLGFTIGVEHSAIVNLRTVHRNRETTGYMWATSILGGKAENKVKGMIRIEKNAPSTNAYFTHNSLLLSPTARVATSPALEIETNEVKASHQATVGHLDADTLFYLHSRGIPLPEAKKLVLVSFAHEHLHEISDIAARDSVSKYLNESIQEII